MRKLSELCLRMVWESRPNEERICTLDKGHEGMHKECDCWNGHDEDCHEKPWILNARYPMAYDGIVMVRGEHFTDDLRTPEERPDLRLRIDILMKGPAFGKPGTNYGRRAEVVRILKGLVKPLSEGTGDCDVLNIPGNEAPIIDSTGELCGYWEVTERKNKS